MRIALLLRLLPARKQLTAKKGEIRSTVAQKYEKNYHIVLAARAAHASS